MLLDIWLVLCQQVPGGNPPGLHALDYANKFTRDEIQECGEASLGFPHEVSIEEEVINREQIQYLWTDDKRKKSAG
jgi:hypothetical protein